MTMLEQMEQAARDAAAKEYAGEDVPRLIRAGRHDDLPNVKLRLDTIRAAYAWLEANGYAIVPKEPTVGMKSAGAFHCISHAWPAGDAELRQATTVYRAMLAAAEGTSHD